MACKRSCGTTLTGGKFYTRGAPPIRKELSFAMRWAAALRPWTGMSGCGGRLWCILVPLIFVVAASFSSPKALLSGKVYLWPVDFTLRGYNMLLGHKLLISGFLNSILYTVVGTVINVIMTVLAAYPLSRRDLAIRNPVMFLFTFTMLFSGGMIPSYMLVKNLHMLDTIWAVVMPTAL